ncbi:hypothetical protein [Methylomonas sp. CM2]|uniref:hypothetical protein n=1 Tax=Methylomonas sp. CM2 TaxID=3417647 RepID=UPI003CEA250F
MSRRGSWRDRPFIEKSAVQVLIEKFGQIDAYRRWFYSNFRESAANDAFKRDWALSLGAARIGPDEVVEALAAWRAAHGDEPPADAAEFVRCWRAPSEGARSGLQAARAALGGSR